MNMQRTLHLAPPFLAECALLAASLLAAACASSRAAGTFASPEAAADALVAALRAEDEQRLRDVIGDEGTEMLSSGDEVADRADRDTFVVAYDAQHQLLAKDDAAMLVVGAGAWPLPLPIRRVDGGWRFDIEAGKDEILSRRIGRNELSAIEVCRAIVDAQEDYAMLDHGHGPGEYAQRFASSAGMHDGLYWPTGEGEPESPLGPLVAIATDEGYAVGTEATAVAQERQPYHGYYYRILTAQGPSAPGGAMSYLVDGRMTLGHAVLAQPAVYGSSGIMSFLAGPNGVLYQRDLGPDTERVAAAIEAFDPTPEWTLVVE